ncbi:MAG: protein tyrosine phosphatase [Coriobacteriia bacterium]|nr:protein tyrosine phosphatase [Coriobacteriia bacterium]
MRDEHCHILWDVDDGSSSWDMTLAMLQGVRESGITQVVCTPHMRWHDFDASKVHAHFERLRAEAPDIEWTLGYEVYYERLMKIGIERAPEFTIGDTNQILLEFNSGGEIPDGWDRAFWQLQSKMGLDITVAHPERYSTVLDDFDMVYRLRDMGCRLQVSAGDLLGGLFNKPRKCARRMLDEGLCDALVSDAHRPEHYAEFRKARDKYWK